MNSSAGRAAPAMLVIAVLALLALFLAQAIPTRPIGIDERKE